MDTRPILAIPLACLLGTGCRQDPYMNVHIEMLNAEKRALEDRVYELEYDYESKETEVENLKNEIGRLRDGREPSAADEPYYEPEMTPPRVELPGESESIPNLTPPKVEPGTPDGVPGDFSMPPTSSSSPSTSSSTTPSMPRESTDHQPLALDLADPRINHIAINSESTGGINLDQQPGDDGIQVVFEPRNPDDVFVPLAGPVSVVLLDTAELQGERRRVARWDLEASEVDPQIRNSAGQQGIYLTLRWPQRTPRHSQLHLFVRFETVDGSRHEAEQVISINPPGQVTRRDWAPRPNPPVDNDPDEHRVRIARPEWKPFR
ncbi:MAG: hypothetical protein ACC628_03365 [Pirellulaceae bacterium]